jgi:hypothetical protein
MATEPLGFSKFQLASIRQHGNTSRWGFPLLSEFARAAFHNWRNHWLRSPLLVTSQHYRLTTPRHLAPATRDPGPCVRVMLLHEEDMPSCVFSSPHGGGLYAGTCVFRPSWTRGIGPAAPRERLGVWLDPFRVRRAHPSPSADD